MMVSYREHYSVTRLRTLVERRNILSDHDDLWCSLHVLSMLLRDDTLQADGLPPVTLLGLLVFNGDLFAEQELDQASIANRDLLNAFWYLTFAPNQQCCPRHRGTRLGLRELARTATAANDARPALGLITHSAERRSTGSHYTHPELVGQIIQQTLEPVIAERLASCRTNAECQAAILNLKVLDPACGLGHFCLRQHDGSARS